MERLKTLAIVVLLVALAGSITLAATGGEAEVRINARQLEDGRVEFALQQRVDGEWGERILPPSRYFPANVGHNRWLNSTPMTVTAADSEAPVARGSYVPQQVPDGNNEDGSLFWTTLDTAAGFRTVLVVTGRSNDGTFDKSFVYLTCDHDDPDAQVYARIGIAYTIGATTRFGSRFDDERSGAWRLGSRYDDTAVEGDVLSSHIEDSWFYIEAEDLLADAMAKRWLSATVPYGHDDWVTITIDLNGAWSTPVQSNLANCEGS